MAFIDLHVHSNASDGTETPAGVVELAAKAGLMAIALTDHDTVPVSYTHLPVPCPRLFRTEGNPHKNEKIGDATGRMHQ